MEWMKILGAALIIVSCSGLSYCPVRRMKERNYEFRCLTLCLIRLKSEMLQAKKTLPEALFEAAKRKGKKSCVRQAFLQLSEQMREGNNSIDMMIHQAAENGFSKDLFLKEEIARFTEIFLSLGGPDLNKQAEILSFYLSEIQEQLKEEQGKLKEKGYLYRALGLLTGVFLTVLLI